MSDQSSSVLADQNEAPHGSTPGADISKRPEWHQLIVIGNGFDLACGLRSSFSDFFRKRDEAFPLFDDIADNALNFDCDAEERGPSQDDGTKNPLGFTKNVWDCILKLTEHGKNWCDVERAIAEWVTTNVEHNMSPMWASPKQTNDNESDSESNIKRLLNEQRKETLSRNSRRKTIRYRRTTAPHVKESDPTDDSCDDDFDYDYDIPSVYEEINSFIKEKYPPSSNWDKPDASDLPRDSKARLYAILLLELQQLERDFTKYMENEVASKKEAYLEMGRKLLLDLSLDELVHTDKNGNKSLDKQYLDLEDDCDINESVLSFNYTKPVEDLNLSNLFHFDSSHQLTFVNVHGQLENDNIVIGIDGTGLTDDDNVLPFTKTYRLMGMDTPDLGKLIQMPTADNPNRPYTALIKFFGHSLAQADYSYFQAIFDAVHLYESNTRLIFYYRPYDGAAADKVKLDTMHKVFHLLNAYGKTLDNEDHGKNLIHKLLIEGRLSVKELKETPTT